MKKKQKTIDLLQLKKQELADYNAQFENAVSVVTKTVNSLEEINTGITEKIAEIDAYEAELSETKKGLNETKSKNEQVMKNFKNLLCAN